MSTLSAPFSEVFAHRQILLRTALVDLRGLYAGSLLGLFWIMAGPLILLTLYGMIYMVIFQIRPVSLTQPQYVLYIFSGLVPYLAFAGSLVAGAGSVSANRDVLLNTVFPAELIPLRTVIVNSTVLLAGVVIVFVADLLIDTISPWAVLVPVFMILQLMFVAGVTWILSLVTLVFRDIQQVLGYLMLILLVMTPIAYTPDMVPANLKFIVYVNPLAYYVVCYQHLLVLNEVPPPFFLIGASAAAIIAYVVGFTTFRRAKQVFFDYA